MVDGVNNMRIGGLASGMDIDQIVGDLMKAERMPLDKLQQDKTLMEWQRDSFRDVNKLLLELDEKILDMKLEKTYTSKSTTSTNPLAVTANAAASSTNGTYSIEVSDLATASINVSDNSIVATGETLDPNKSFAEQPNSFAGGIQTGTFKFYTFDEKGVEVAHEVKVSNTDTLNSVLNRITKADNGVRAFYDNQSGKVVMERTTTGDFNKDTANYGGKEIVFKAGESDFFTGTLGLSQASETGGTNATFKYNGALELESTTNNYTLNGITFNFSNTTPTGQPAKITVSNDVDAAVDKIVAFVDKYNEVIEKINGKLNEDKYRDFKPLTEEQKKEMSDKDIERWEEKAKSGLLKGETILSTGLTGMRQGWYGTVSNTSEFTHLSEIGIKTSSNYLDAGKLIIDEDELKQALSSNPESVYKLFSNDVKGDGRGIINRLEDSIEKTTSNIEEKAGKSTLTQEQYTMGRRLKDMDDRIAAFTRRLTDVENRYWKQFTAMEKAIQRMNEQSAYMLQQFNGGA